MQIVTEIIREIEKHVKAIVAAVGSILTAIVGLSDQFGLTFIHEDARLTLTFIFAGITAVATWAVPNYQIEIKE